MIIAILVKQVPSSEARIRIVESGSSIDTADVEFVINPYDEYALEAGMQLKEKFGGETIAVVLGPEDADRTLRECLALGVDRAVRVWDPSLAGGCVSIKARAIAAACSHLKPDLVLCGKLSIDEENSALGVQVAEYLEMPHVSVVSQLEAESETRFLVHREIEGGTEIWEVDLPAVITANKGLNEPRRKTIKGIMAAKKKPVELLGQAGPGPDAGRDETCATLRAMEYPPPRKPGEILQGTPGEAVSLLVRKLRDEVKVL